MKRFLILVTFVLMGCQSTQHNDVMLAKDVDHLYLDTSFLGHRFILLEDEEEVFSPDEAMIAFVDKHIMVNDSKYRKAEKLLKAIFDKQGISLDYQSNANLTAQQTFHQKRANCLSLTIMSYTLAKLANIDIEFQQVEIPEYWIRQQDYSLLAEHINLLIPPERQTDTRIIYGSDTLEIDFDPFTRKKLFDKHIIDKNTVLAMYYNNKAAQAMIDEHFTTAYAYLKQATKSDPNYSSAWANLGLLYRFNDEFDAAKQVYEHAISLDGNNLNVQSNLAVLLSVMGMHEESETLQKAIYAKRIRNPYYHYLLGNEAHARSQYQEAIRHYRKAIDLYKRDHEFYFAMALSYFKLGETAKVRHFINKAIKISPFDDVDQQYSAKIEYLNAYNP